MRKRILMTVLSIVVHRMVGLTWNYINHLRSVLECMRTDNVYVNASKCLFEAKEIPFLGSYISKQGLRADPAEFKVIVYWQFLKNRKDLRKRLGLANYLHQYSANGVDMDRPLFNLYNKDME